MKLLIFALLLIGGYFTATPLEGWFFSYPEQQKNTCESISITELTPEMERQWEQGGNILPRIKTR